MTSPTQNPNTYDVDAHVAEIYDQTETQTDDVRLLRTLIGQRGPWRIFEPFCGTGRMFLPLAADGHEIVGMDRAKAMLDRARVKVADLSADVRGRIALIEADVVAADWPGNFDLVVLGGNCFYELPTPEEQERCIARAAASLKPGGFVYVDNGHMEGELDVAWRQPGITRGRFPTGTCADATRVDGTNETIWWDAPRRLVRFRRTVTVTPPGGEPQQHEYLQQKHPVSMGEVKGWLEKHGFAIEHLYGDRAGNPYTPQSPRAIFWAQKVK